MKEIVHPIFHEMSQGIHQQQSHHNSSLTHHAEPACASSETGERCPASAADCYEYKTVPTWFGPMRVKALKKCCKTPRAQNGKSDTNSQHSSKENATRDDNTARSSESVRISNEEKNASGTTKATAATDESKGGEPVVENTWACQTDTDAQGNSTSDGFAEATPANKGDKGDLQTSSDNTEPIALGYNPTIDEQRKEASKTKPNDVQEPIADESESPEHSEDDSEAEQDGDIQKQTVDEPQSVLTKDAEDVPELQGIEPDSDYEFVVVEKEMKSDDGESSYSAAVAEFQNQEQVDLYQSTEADTPPSDQLSTDDITKFGIDGKTPALVPEPKVWSATFNLSDYNQSEVEVKTVGQCLVVEAEHEEETDDGGMSQQFRKSITLPADVDPESVSCSLDDAGVLHAKAFRLENNVVSKDIVPIAMA